MKSGRLIAAAVVAAVGGVGYWMHRKGLLVWSITRKSDAPPVDGADVPLRVRFDGTDAARETEEAQSLAGWGDPDAVHVCGADCDCSRPRRGASPGERFGEDEESMEAEHELAAHMDPYQQQAPFGYVPPRPTPQRRIESANVPRQEPVIKRRSL